MAKKSKTLFQEEEIYTDSLPVVSVVEKQSDVFSKFNKAVEESEKLNNQIADTSKLIEETKTAIQKELNGVLEELVAERMLFFDKCDLILEAKITPGQRDFILELIMANIEILRDEYHREVFYVYEKYFPEKAQIVKDNLQKMQENPEQFEKMTEEEIKNDINNMFKQMFEDVFGIDSEEVEDIFEAENMFKDIFEEKKERKKTKAQIKKEEERLKKEEMEKEVIVKSIKSVYVKLAKALHPDLEQDEEIKQIKTGLMQKITEAYSNKDFYTLLKISVNNPYIDLKESHLDELSEESISIYLKIIKEQNAELKNKLWCLKNQEHQGFFKRYCTANIKTVITRERANLNSEIYAAKFVNETFSDIKRAKNYIKQNKFFFPKSLLKGITEERSLEKYFGI